MQMDRGVELLNSENSAGLLDLIEAQLTADETDSAVHLRAAAFSLLQTPLVHVLPANEDIQYSPDGKYPITTHGAEARNRDATSSQLVSEPLKLERNIDQRR
jgi:hypothetical protein